MSDEDYNTFEYHDEDYNPFDGLFEPEPEPNDWVEAAVPLYADSEVESAPPAPPATAADAGIGTGDNRAVRIKRLEYPTLNGRGRYGYGFNGESKGVVRDG